MQVLSLLAKRYPDMREQRRKKANATLPTLSYSRLSEFSEQVIISCEIFVGESCPDSGQ